MTPDTWKSERSHTKEMFKRTGCILLFGLLFSIAAMGNTIYTYSGQPFTTYRCSGSPCNSIPELSSSDRITGSLMVSSPLIGVVGNLPAGSVWSFSVGSYSWSSSDGDETGGQYFQGDASGNLIEWELPIRRPGMGYPGLNIYSNAFAGFGDTFIALGSPGLDIASNTTPGTWTMQSTSGVPEPGTLSLVILATLGAVLMKSKRRRC